MQLFSHLRHSAWFCFLLELSVQVCHQPIFLLRLADCFLNFRLNVYYTFAGFIGMALSYGLSLNMSLVSSIQNQCTLANYIISVERLNQYMHIPSEAPVIVKENRPPVNWPTRGKVEIQDLQVNLVSPP